MRIRGSRTTAGLTLVAVAVVPLMAGTFAVNPVRVQLSAKQLHSAIRIANAGEEKVSIQAHIMLWGKDGNADALEDTDEVIVNPPIFAIAPHQTQFLRLGLRTFKPTAAEQAYRLILEEVPPPLAPSFSGLRTLLRISLPIFVAPLQLAQPLLVWQVRESAGGPILSVQNRGNAHIQLKQISVTRAPGGEAIFTALHAVYVLPGGQCEWHMDGVETGSSGLLVRAVTDHGPLGETLPPPQ